MSNKKIIITNTHNRGILNEGRSCGMGHAFLVKKGENVYDAMMPITACKDFLNDVVYSERSGKAHRIYGFSTVKTGLFESSDMAYLETAILPYNRTTRKHDNFEKQLKGLEENTKGIQACINELEKMLGFTTFSTLEKAEDNRFLLTIPLKWTESTFMISLVTLVARCGHYYKDGDVLAYFKDFEEDGTDRGYLDSAHTKIKKMAKDGIPAQDMSDLSPHDMGIVSCTI